MKLLDFKFSIVLFLLAIFASAIGAPLNFICLPSTHINKNCDILACSTMATTYVNTVCYEPNTGANQHECEQQSKRNELRSEKFLYEKSKLLDLGRSAILPITRKVLHNLCSYGKSKHNHFNTHAGPFKRPRGKRGGRRKQRKIKVQLTQRFVSPSPNFNIRKVSHGNLQTICTDLVEQEPTKHLRIGYINTQSCRNKTE